MWAIFIIGVGAGCVGVGGVGAVVGRACTEEGVCTAVGTLVGTGVAGAS